MNDEVLKYWMALKTIFGIGNTLFQKLLEHFDYLPAVFSASIEELCCIKGITKKIAMDIVSFNNWNDILRQWEQIEKSGIRIVTCRDKSYPRNLLNIYDYPVLLYVRGTLEGNDIPLAIVGSRSASAYGRYTTERISRELALRGFTIVSGMARGIDSCAHRGALTARGRTIAVLGNSLDVIYPPENQKMFADIIENGAALTEYPPQTQPLPHHFPARNRIISGLSYGVLVVEAGEKSGSLITAKLAMEQGRDVFAIPGSIDSGSSRGTHSLIKQGAKLTESVDDILEEILPQLERIPAVKTRQTDSFFPAPPQEKVRPMDQAILRCLSQTRMHADDIIASTGIPSAEVLSTLMCLELKGIIEQHPGKLFSLKK